MKEQLKSYMMLVASMLIFGTIGIFRRYIPLSSAVLACVRGFTGSICIAGYMKITGRKFRNAGDEKQVLPAAFSGVMIGVNWILLFEAYNYTSVSAATLCYYMQPAIVLLASPFLLKERLTGKKVICACAAAAGMILVSGVLENGAEAVNFRGIFYALGAAILYASVIILNKLVKMEDMYERTIIQLSAAAIVIVPYVILTEDIAEIHLDLFSAVMVLIVGVVHTGIAYALYFGSMKNLKGQSVAVLSYIDPCTALLLSALILHESLTAGGIIGAVLIIGSALGSELWGE